MHSKWPEIQTSKDVTTETVITFLRTLFVRWSLPRQIITDNGPQFTSYRFQEFLKQHNIKHMRTSCYHPQGNGEVEWFNQVLRHGLVTYLAEGTSVTEALQSILFNYQATNHALTGKSPAELMIGRKIREPLPMLNPNTAGEKLRSTSYQRIRNRIHIKQAKQKVYTDSDRSAVYRSFQPGDWVRVKRPHTGHKLKLKLPEPIQVQRKLAEFSYRLQDGSRRHVNALVGTKWEIDQNTDARAADSIRPWVREERDEEDRREKPEVETKRSMRNRQRPQHLKDYYVQYNT